MTERYRHTQVGYVILILLGAILILLGAMLFLLACLAAAFRLNNTMLAVAIVFGLNEMILVVMVVLVICLLLFGTLTVAIENDVLEIRFGLGLIRKRFSLKDSESVHIVRNPWYYGWGIHLTPHGWLYNVSGVYAVELKLKNGRKYRIGTDVPDELERAIRQSIDRLAG